MEEENKGEENHPAADSDWILDSLVAYLRGPIWVMPILTFIEQKSVGKSLLLMNTLVYGLMILTFCSQFSTARGITRWNSDKFTMLTAT